jgi:hypothetical protein
VRLLVSFIRNFSVVLGPFLFPVTMYCVLKYVEAKSSNINTFYVKVMAEKVPPTIRLLCKAGINGVGQSCAFSPRITAGSIVKPVFDTT